MTRNSSRSHLIFLGTLVAFPGASAAQFRGVDLSYGRWWHQDGEAAEIYTATWNRHFFGPVEYGLGVVHVADGQSLVDATLTGGEVSLTVGGIRGGIYGTTGGGLGLQHRDGSLDAHWSVGVGYALQPLSFLRFAFDARYRVEDRGVRGFWNLTSTDRKGVNVRAGLALRFHTGAPRGGRPPLGTTSQEPARRRPALATVARLPGSESSDAMLRNQIVATALEAMGSPYRWGGSDGNGFDCSGLIQYAYSVHGIILPRVSAQQARTGTLIETTVDALEPGDILGFRVNGSGVSHVGLYVGDGQFIHSSSDGVRLSDLTGNEPDGAWYRQRWVAARRILD